MAKTVGDVCSTCDRVSACAQPTAPEQRASECRGSASPREEVPERRTKRSPLRREAAAARDLLLGLCCDCENREGCCLAEGSEGGVWHCEEYS